MNNHVSLEEIHSALSIHGDPWFVGETSLSSLPLEEKKQYLGASPPPDVPSIDEIEQRVFAMREEIDNEGLRAFRENTSRDLRNVDGENYVTPIKDQKRCGSCVAFATLATAESTLQFQQKYSNGIDLSEAHLFFCLANALGKTCETGWWVKEALDRFKDNGVYGESFLKYDEALARDPHCSGFQLSPEYYFKITGYEDLTGQPALIKEWIDKKGPVIASFIVYEDFIYIKAGYTSMWPANVPARIAWQSSVITTARVAGFAKIAGERTGGRKVSSELHTASAVFICGRITVLQALRVFTLRIRLIRILVNVLSMIARHIDGISRTADSSESF